MDIIDAFLRLSPIAAESKKALQDVVSARHYHKGEHLLELWQIDRHIHFIKKGSGRVYYLRDGRDITDYIAMDGHFLGGVESLFTQQPSQKAIELTEDSEVQSIPYQALEELCARYHDIERLGRKLAIFSFLEAQKRIETIRFLSASERYQELERKYPGIPNRIPLKHLASYLGTTQVSLSRIRSGVQ